VVAKNKRLREVIEKILKENVRVGKKYSQLKSVSKKNQAEIDNLVDQATTAYDQRFATVGLSVVKYINSIDTC